MRSYFSWASIGDVITFPKQIHFKHEKNNRLQLNINSQLFSFPKQSFQHYIIEMTSISGKISHNYSIELSYLHWLRSSSFSHSLSRFFYSNPETNAPLTAFNVLFKYKLHIYNNWKIEMAMRNCNKQCDLNAFQHYGHQSFFE